MSDPANAESFAQPHWRVIASGFDIRRWFDANPLYPTVFAQPIEMSALD